MHLNNAVPTKPVFFLKVDTALLTKNKPFYLPSFSTDIHYELELVVKINRVGKHIEERFANRYYDEVGLSGVGQLKVGNKLKAYLGDKLMMNFEIR